MKRIFLLFILLVVGLACFASADDQPSLGLQTLLKNSPKARPADGTFHIIGMQGNGIRQLSYSSVRPPIATTTTPGTVKVGSGLAITPDGTLNNTGIAGVASFNGRGGPVQPQAGDYSITQISGAAAVAASNSYLDLKDRPTIPPAQVPADWNQTIITAPDYIKGKPTIPSQLSQLAGDSTHRTVTDAEKAGWNSNSSPVQSVFGRTGAVVKQPGDYTAVDVGADPLGSATSVQSNLDLHKGLINNPHQVTKAQVGLGSVPDLDATNPANITQDATHRFATDTEKSVWNAKQAALGFTPENTANKAVANGYASLDAAGKIPAAQVPAPAAIGALAATAQAADSAKLGGTASATVVAGAAAGATALQPASIVDNLTSTSTNTPLSANQGKVLKGLIDASVTVFNVAQPPYNADKTGVTDATTAITAAITAASAAGGGTVYLPTGTYKFTPPLNLPPNVDLLGDGSCSDENCTAATTLSVGTTYNGPGIVIGTGGAMQYGNSVSELNIKLNDKARGGIYFNAAVSGIYQNVYVLGTNTGAAPTYAQYGYYLTTTSTGANVNTMFNTFENVKASMVNNIFKFGYSALSNVCHNSFINVGGSFYGDGMDLVGADNNNFSMTYLFARPGATGYGVKLTHGTANDSYFFYQLQSERGMYVGSNVKAVVFGYDRTNGQPAPTLQDSTATLSWTTDAANADGWHVSGDLNLLPGSKIKDGTYSKSLSELIVSSQDCSVLGTGYHLQKFDASTNTFTCSADSTTGSVNDSNAIHVNGTNEIAGLTEKVAPIGNDVIVVEDSANGYAKRKAKISSIPLAAVTNVDSANGDIAVTNKSTTPVLTLNSGSGANQIAKLNADAGLTLSGSDWIAGAGTVTANGATALTVNTAGAFSVLKPGAVIKFSNNTEAAVLSIAGDGNTAYMAQNVSATAYTWSYRNPALTWRANGADLGYLEGNGTIDLLGDGLNGPRIYTHSWGTPGGVVGFTAGGTPSSPTSTPVSTILYSTAGGGLTTTGNWAVGAGIQYKAGENWGTGVAGTGSGAYMVFNTTNNNTGSQTEKARLDGNGRLGINTTAPTAMLHVKGKATVQEVTYTRAGSSDGLRDLTASGTYTGPGGETYTIIIDATGTPDTFKWKKNSGSYTTGVAVTGSNQTLSDGVQVKLTATTGHTLNDQWVISMPMPLEVDNASGTALITVDNSGNAKVTGDVTAPTFNGLAFPTSTPVGTTDTQTLSNKTLTAPAINGESCQMYSASPASGTAQMDLNLYDHAELTPSGSFTFVLSNLPASGRIKYATMHIVPSANVTITWPTLTAIGGTAPATSLLSGKKYDYTLEITPSETRINVLAEGY